MCILEPSPFSLIVKLPEQINLLPKLVADAASVNDNNNK